MSMMRINTNIATVTSQRHLSNNNAKMTSNMEKMSSGLRVNRGADGPADLVISEKLRGQIASLTQAISNNETSVSVVQTAESALDEVNRALVRMRQLAVHASNEGANDENMLKADQLEYDNMISQLDRIASNTSFGDKELLNGEHGNLGTAIGRGLDFISATAKTASAGESGQFNIAVTQSATNSFYESNTKLDEEAINNGEVLKISEGGKTAVVVSELGDTANSLVSKLKAAVKRNDIQVEVALNDDDEIQVRHLKKGSEHSFSIYSTTTGILSREEGEFLEVQNGQDVAGTIGGPAAYGRGEYLTGGEGTPAEGMTVRYQHTGEEPIESEKGVGVGSIQFKQNGLRFQIGSDYGQTIRFGLPSVFADMLGRNVDNSSNFNSLSDIDLKSFNGAQDALLLIDKAIGQVTLSRGELGAVQKYSLEANKRFLMGARENIIGAESIIRDADMAEEITTFTKNSILNQTSMAALSHASKTPQTILTLLQ